MSALLISRLAQQIQQLMRTYEQNRDKILFYHFERTVFSQDNETVGFYLDEINRTFKQLQMQSVDQFAQYEFLAKRLAGQVSAFCEAIRPKAKTPIPITISPNQTSSTDPNSHPAHSLPPRERLVEYYRALETLNTRLMESRDNCQITQDIALKARYQQQYESLKARRQKCQEAIDLLEEYLAWKDEKEANLLNKQD